MYIFWNRSTRQVRDRHHLLIRNYQNVRVSDMSSRQIMFEAMTEAVLNENNLIHTRNGLNGLMVVASHLKLIVRYFGHKIYIDFENTNYRSVGR
jgi:hypothetical protein